MPATDFETEERYEGNRFYTEKLHQDARQKTMLGYFEPGEFIPVHAPDSTLTVVVHEGHGIVREGDVDHEVEAGDVVVIPAGEDRGVRADDTRLKAALVVSPPPGDAAHQKVREGLKNDEWMP